MATLLVLFALAAGPAPEVRVRLKSSIPGVRLVGAEGGRALCAADCGGELLIARGLRLALVDHSGHALVSRIELPSTAGRAVIHFEGNDRALVGVGIAGSAIGVSLATAALGVLLASLIAGGQQDGGPRASELAVTGLTLGVGALAFGVPGGILWAKGASPRWDISDR
jgi:hypothetical protein